MTRERIRKVATMSEGVKEERKRQGWDGRNRVGKEELRTGGKVFF